MGKNISWRMHLVRLVGPSVVVALATAALVPATAQKVDKNNTLSADRPILACPVAQKTVKNGARPSADLLKKLVRCSKGELAADKGMDGAVTVEVSALQIGTPRKWDYLRDTGNGNAQTKVFPVKVTYTVKTFYRTRTVVEAGWIRVMNFYVNAFGEWQSGSEEPIKPPKTTSYPRKA